MKFYKALLTTTICMVSTFHGTTSMAATQTSTEKNGNLSNEGDIVFFDKDGATKCTLTVPEKSQIFDFSQSSQHCENNSVVSFTLQNIPSATLIQFYDNVSCSDGQNRDNFFVKLKTTKQPTDWADARQDFNYFKDKTTGDQVPGKNIRIEQQWESEDNKPKDWNERISCVYIERSQPVN